MSPAKPPLTPVRESFDALRRDLLHTGGPSISTMRNYRFAILPYPPQLEFELRGLAAELVRDLETGGWVVLTLSLQQLLLNRVRSLGDQAVQTMIQTESKLADRAPERAFRHLRSKMTRLIEGPDGIAGDVAARICAFAEAQPEKAERTLVLVARAGALYPFYRSSALLKHIDGRTQNVPVVLLYPGSKTHDNRLSFMGQVAADGDYRPRIY